MVSGIGIGIGSGHVCWLWNPICERMKIIESINGKRIGSELGETSGEVWDASSHKKMMSVEKNESIYGLTSSEHRELRESVRVLRESVRELNYNI